MSEYLKTTYDKFTFQVKASYRYSQDDIWAWLQKDLVTVEVSDFLQRRSGDVAFVELPAVDEEVAAGERCGLIETIKITQDIPSPLSGVVSAVNQELEIRPELINEDPYGRGWLFQMRPIDPAAFNDELLDAQAYLQFLVGRLENEARKIGH